MLFIVDVVRTPDQVGLQAAGATAVPSKQRTAVVVSTINSGLQQYREMPLFLFFGLPLLSLGPLLHSVLS